MHKKGFYDLTVRIIIPFSVFILSFLVISCHHPGKQNKKEKILTAAGEQADIPVLTPSQSIDKMKVEDGFKVQLVASEPLISSPVTITFDNKGRIWVAEMRGFKPIMDSVGAPLPKGKVVILEDTNSDGKMDRSKIFLDSLDAPRAIYVDNDGILLATPPNLWYIENNGDKPGKRILIDSNYTVTHNDEGQTNGLFRSLDNWIYSAGFGSNKRYRKIDNKWVTEPTILRGQWGITQDNFGRLYYNHNSTQLMGDFFMPGLVDTNSYQRQIAGYNVVTVPDQRVYPIEPTPGVNNPFREGMLDNELRLLHFTAACGPVIYRGDLFGKEYRQNAFVAAPVAHLIKRNILKEEGYKIIGQQAYKDKEFLTSTDKRFRPVTLKNGPDGALYIVDMYRGVIEDSMWVTPYLKQYALNHQLNHPVNTGRIYKIIPTNATPNETTIPDDLNTLVDLLGSDNGWVRDHAQKRLVEGRYEKAIPVLKKIIRNKGANLFQKIHSLWTLEGLGSLNFQDIKGLLFNNSYKLQIQALSALSGLINKNNYKTYLPLIKKLISRKDSLIAPDIAYVVNRLQRFDPEVSKGLIGSLLSIYPNNKFVVDALINGLPGQEEKYLDIYSDSSKMFNQHLSKVLKRKQLRNNKDAKRIYAKGYSIFETYCVMCHGSDGNGLKTMGPPLNNSEFVVGNKYRLIAIIMNGLNGTVTVNGKVYKKSDTNIEMPAFKDKLSDGKAARLINYIRHAWNNNASRITSNDISIIRYKTIDREQPFTPEGLDNLFNK